jgi:pyruvate ferredoxin oxidoreductase gamma subunit/2-oxoisovalerate ferredoxin oxidoreductase gamma subunit
MYEIRFHGRGGQGAVTAANILAAAAFKENKFVQSFPMFGVERRGAPVMAFLRLDDKPIELKTQIYEPNAVIVLDPTLLTVIDVTSGLRQDGIIIINTSKVPQNLKTKNKKIFIVDATGIALANKLGTRTNPIVNTAILGAYAKAIGNIKLDSIIQAISELAPSKKEENIKASREAFESTREV